MHIPKNMNKNDFFRIIAHLIFRTGHFKSKNIKRFAKGIRNKRILELGSGKNVKGKYPYSDKQFFDSSNEFIQSDVVKEYGHKVVDVTNMKFKNKFDVILCTNLLEHVYDFRKAIENVYNALKPNGTAIIFIPVFYPFHDEPHDYWRFTEHSFRKLLKDFSSIKIRHSGLRQYPFAYYVEATK